MFERFTDRARKCLVFAQDEALRLNHPQIDDVHILVGIVKEGLGIAGSYLHKLGLNYEPCRESVERARPRIEGMPPSSRLPRSQLMDKIVEAAIANARQLNDNYVGTEHLLLGVLEHSGTITATILEDARASKEGLLAYREQIL